MEPPKSATMKTLSRRNVLTALGLTAAGAISLGVPLSSMDAKSASKLSSSKMPRPFQRGFVVPPTLQPYKTGINPNDGKPVNYYSVDEVVSSTEIVPGMRTPILGYNGIFPGPTIVASQGTHSVLTVRNRLPGVHPVFKTPTATSTHLHGSASLPQYDGYASDVTLPGFKKDYHYNHFQPARTLWYHDHGVHYTAENAYSGLAALFLMHDQVERSLLPQGEFDVPLVINDVQFQKNGAPMYDDHSHSGLWGDVILVNGTPWPVMNVKKRIYRFRILNCSLSRSFNFRLSTKEPLTVVATDGGLMPQAQTVNNFRHAGAERYEVLIDFSKYRAGQEIILQNTSNKNNIDYDHTNKVMKFVVVDDAFTTDDPSATAAPATLVPSHTMSLPESSSVKKRSMRVKREGGLWTIDGKGWHEVVKSNFEYTWANPNLNDVEIWDIENKSGGWFHPMHLHLVDFKILSRNGKPAFNFEQGPKDVVYVGEGETVRLLIKFEHQRGRYMIHCHNLPHEDHDMMTQFSVGWKEGDYDPNHPIEAAKPVWDAPVTA